MNTLGLAVVAEALSADARAAPEMARRLEFAGLVYEAESSRLALTELSGTGRREFRRVLAGQDQQLVALSTGLSPRGLGAGADVDRMVARLDRAMEAAAGLGAPLLCVEVGPLPHVAMEPGPSPGQARVTPGMAGAILLPNPADLKLVAESPPAEAPRPPVNEALVSQVDAAMQELGRRADRYSVVVAFRSDLSQLSALECAVKQADCPWFGIELDPVAVLGDVWPMEEVFNRLGPLVRHVRARDALGGQDRRTQPAAIGQGHTQWAQVLLLLDEAGYEGWITVDPTELTDRLDGARRGLEHLRRVRTTR